MIVVIHGLTEEEKFQILRPMIGECEYDKFGIPIVKSSPILFNNINKIKIVGLQNAKPDIRNKEKLLHMFNYDKRLAILWNNPLKYVGLFQSYFAVATPDYSIYPNMNINDIRHNVYKQRWLGKIWQNYGCNVWPTVGWAESNTYDLCFASIEEGSVVTISTIGCQKSKEMFLEGFNEMKKRIKPRLVVVYGEMIQGMTGTFINFKYIEAFEKNYEQLRLECVPTVFTIEEEM